MLTIYRVNQYYLYNCNYLSLKAHYPPELNQNKKIPGAIGRVSLQMFKVLRLISVVRVVLGLV